MKKKSRRNQSRESSWSFDVSILGCGSFGTALATLLAENERRVRVWVRSRAQADEINRRHSNREFFPKRPLPHNIEASTDLAAAVTGAPLLIFAVPSKAFREVARQVGDHLQGDQILLHCTKGLEPRTFKRMSEIVREESCALKVGVISGPTFAAELMAGQPAGASVASHFDEVALRAQALFAGSPLRLYRGHDVIGTEIGGAFKNIIALLSGAAHGLGFGDNTRALIVTRGLGEMTRYGVALGAEAETFRGLAGIGDLLVTCSSTLSRNFRVGMRFAQGEKLDSILRTASQVVEGIPATQVVYEQAKQLKLDLPFVRAVYGAFYQKLPLKDLLVKLTGRPLKAEQDLLPRSGRKAR